MPIKEVEEILSIKVIPTVDQTEEVRKIYLTKALLLAQDEDGLYSKFVSLERNGFIRWLQELELMEACKKMGLTSGWMDEKNRELGLILESTEDAKDEKMELDAETAAEEFIQKIY
jgi:hypothetical protein